MEVSVKFKGTEKIFIEFSKEMLNQQFGEKMKLKENCQRWKRKWKLEDGSKRVQKSPFHESFRELESQRFPHHQANLWADTAHRERIYLCGEWEMKKYVLPRMSYKRLPRIQRIEKSLL